MVQFFTFSQFTIGAWASYSTEQGTYLLYSKLPPDAVGFHWNHFFCSGLPFHCQWCILEGCNVRSEQQSGIQCCLGDLQKQWNKQSNVREVIERAFLASQIILNFIMLELIFSSYFYNRILNLLAIYRQSLVKKTNKKNIPSN